MYMEMTCGLRLGTSRVAVARTEHIILRQNGTSSHTEENVVEGLEVPWVTHSDVSVLQLCVITPE
jgi:ribosomal protein L27